MVKKNGYWAFFIIFVLVAAFSNISEGIEILPTQEQIDDAIKYGETHSENIFGSERMKPAAFGNWPDVGGGLTKSKLIRLTVISAMKVRAKKKISKDDINTVLNSDSLSISYRGGDDVYKIKLMQGTRIIEPEEVRKPEMGDKDLKHKTIFTVASFPYTALELNAKTTVIIVKDFGTEKYEVDFSSFQ